MPFRDEDEGNILYQDWKPRSYNLKKKPTDI